MRCIVIGEIEFDYGPRELKTASVLFLKSTMRRNKVVVSFS